MDEVYLYSIALCPSKLGVIVMRVWM